MVAFLKACSVQNSRPTARTSLLREGERMDTVMIVEVIH